MTAMAGAARGFGTRSRYVKATAVHCEAHEDRAIEPRDTPTQSDRCLQTWRPSRLIDAEDSAHNMPPVVRLPL
jgi:hypothetical protein